MRKKAVILFGGLAAAVILAALTAYLAYKPVLSAESTDKNGKDFIVKESGDAYKGYLVYQENGGNAGEIRVQCCGDTGHPASIQSEPTVENDSAAGSLLHF